MNIVHLRLSAVILFACMVFASCKKNNNNSSTVTTVDKSGVGYFSSLYYTPQSFSVAAGTDTKIKGAQGTILEFYPNSFKDKNGNIITSGTVNISLTEMYQLGDMIANRTSTVTGSGAVLTSGGEVNITATMNGQEVFANKYKIGFKAPAATSSPMELYYGSNANADSITTWGTAQTAKGQTTPGTTYVTDSSVWRFVEAPFFCI